MKCETSIVDKSTIVSMKMFCFTRDIMKYVERGFFPFMNENKNHLDTCEYFIPSVVSDLINNKEISIEIFATTSKW